MFLPPRCDRSYPPYLAALSSPDSRTRNRSSSGVKSSSLRKLRFRRLNAMAGLLSPPVERAVEGDGGVDQRQMREGLGEVAQLLPGLADLLGVQAQVVGVGEHLLEGQPGQFQAAGAGQGIHVPEGADREGALVAAEPVRGGAGVVA